MDIKAHLTTEGFNKIVSLKAAINRGLSPLLKAEFKDVLPATRFVIKTIPDPNWISGFIDGNFNVNKTKYGLGLRAQLRFRATQHIRDKQLKEAIVRYFGTGSVNNYSNGQEAVNLIITNFSDIQNVPFFDKYPLHGIKQLDYFDWRKAVLLKSKGAHLTPEGIKLLQDIKAGMNTGRII